MSNPPYPLHESVKDRLHPDYVNFYNNFLINQPQTHYQPISISRAGSPIVAGGSNPVPVGRKQDYLIRRRETPGPQVPVRVFTPVGSSAGCDGWPVVLYLHGGGFVLGNIDTENTVCSHMCIRAQCVVITVDYRLAPESPFPLPLHDCWEAFLWMIDEGASLLKLDLRKIAIGGASAGANLAAVVARRATEGPWPKIYQVLAQVLVVPVLDNTADTKNNPTWAAYRFTAALNAEKMLWYRRHYLPNEKDWSNPEASPLLTPIESLCRVPPALIFVAELDILRHEGEEYARKLQEAGVVVDLQLMRGMPHPFLAMDAVLEAGRSATTMICETLSRAFGAQSNMSSEGSGRQL